MKLRMSSITMNATTPAAPPAIIDDCSLPPLDLDVFAYTQPATPIPHSSAINPFPIVLVYHAHYMANFSAIAANAR